MEARGRPQVEGDKLGEIGELAHQQGQIGEIVVG